MSRRRGRRDCGLQNEWQPPGTCSRKRYINARRNPSKIARVGPLVRPTDPDFPLQFVLSLPATTVVEDSSLFFAIALGPPIDSLLRCNPLHTPPHLLPRVQRAPALSASRSKRSSRNSALQKESPRTVGNREWNSPASALGPNRQTLDQKKTHDKINFIDVVMVKEWKNGRGGARAGGRAGDLVASALDDQGDELVPEGELLQARRSILLLFGGAPGAGAHGGGREGRKGSELDHVLPSLLLALRQASDNF